MSQLADEQYVARQIILTLSYTDQFEFPLTADELWQRLMYSPQFLVERNVFNKALKQLQKKQLIANEQGFYSLPNRQYTVELRQQRERWSAEKQSSVQQFLRIARLVPWVKAVAVTGSLAMANARRESDVDFMIVTAARRLWITRLLLLIVTSLMGKRRTTKGETPNSWCFNLWTEENYLQVPQAKQSLYTAYEVCQVQWVYDTADVPLKFYEQNSWVEQFVPTYYGEKLFTASHNQYPIKEKLTAAPVLRWLGNRVLDTLNLAAYVLQRIYMYPKLTREQVELQRAYFHPRDTQRLVYTRWQHALRQSQ